MNSDQISKGEWMKWKEKLVRAAPTFEPSRENSEKVSITFGEFCKISGIVLDVGCGSSKAPYLRSVHNEIVGLDPLPPKGSGLDSVCGLGEFLPFRSEIFDQCLCATTLDHCIRPKMVLNEMRRVIKKDGKINLWIGVFDLPKGERSWTHLFGQNAQEGWSLLRDGEFRYLGKAAWIKLLGTLRKLPIRIRRLFRLNIDPWHLYYFRERDVCSLLGQSGLSITERKLLDRSLFLTVRRQSETAAI